MAVELGSYRRPRGEASPGPRRTPAHEHKGIRSTAVDRPAIPRWPIRLVPVGGQPLADPRRMIAERARLWPGFRWLIRSGE